MGEKLESVVISRQWLGVAEASAYLGTSKKTIIDLMDAGTLTKHKIGPHRTSRVLLAKSELDRFVESCRQPAVTA